MGQTILGILTLPSNTRVRTADGLIKLSELASTPGPQGPPGPQGIQGIQDEQCDIDTTNYYNRLQTDFAILVAKPTSSLSTGAKKMMLLQIPSATLSVKTGCKPSYSWTPQMPRIHKTAR